MKSLVLLSAILFCSHLSAAPALWYKWRSKVDGKVFCTQTPAGQGWDKINVPYKDARCEQPAPGRQQE